MLKFIVVKNGNTKGPAIYTNQEDAQRAISGHEAPEYKEFEKAGDAIRYLKEGMPKRKQRRERPADTIEYHNIAFDQVVKNHAGDICIYSTGGYNNEEKTGYYRVLLRKGDKYKLLEADGIKCGSANQILLKSVYDALDKIADNNPQRVSVICSTPLGFVSAKSGKGANADMIQSIFEKVERKKLNVIYIATEGHGNEIRNYILSKANLKE